MFSKFFISALVGFAAVASAAPTGSEGSSDQCATATPQCCQNVQNSNEAGVASLIKGLLGIDVSGLNVPIGTGCSSIVIGGGVSCNQNTVCCGDVYAPQLIGINCVPIIINF